MRTKDITIRSETIEPQSLKGSISLRIGEQTRLLIDEAASALGKSRTEFMIDCARREAIDVLLDQRLFSLDGDAHDRFVATLDEPPKPGDRLKRLMKSKSPGH